MRSLPRLNVQVLAFTTLVSLLGRSLGCILAPGVSERQSFLSQSFLPSYKAKSEASRPDGPDLKPEPRTLALGTGPGPAPGSSVLWRI